MEAQKEERRFKLPQDIKKVIIELDKINGKRLRRVSAISKDTSQPSITITAELSTLNLKKGDWVLVYTENNKVIIEPVSKQAT